MTPGVLKARELGLLDNLLMGLTGGTPQRLQEGHSWRLTVKLRGRPKAPDWSRGCTLSCRTRGDTTDVHGPLQRLLDVAMSTHCKSWTEVTKAPSWPIAHSKSGSSM